jgi:hypothetical protein
MMDLTVAHVDGYHLSPTVLLSPTHCVAAGTTYPQDNVCVKKDRKKDAAQDVFILIPAGLHEA